MDNMTPTPQSDIDRDAPTRGDVQKMISDHTYSRTEIDGKFKSRDDRLVHQLDKKADVDDLEELKAMFRQVVAQMAALTDKSQTFMHTFTTTTQAEFKQIRDLDALRAQSWQRENDEIHALLRTVTNSQQRQAAQHDELVEDVRGLERTEAQARTASALAWQNTETALERQNEVIQEIRDAIKGNEDEGVEGIEPRLKAIEGKMVWVGAVQSIITSRWFIGGVITLFGGGGGVALLDKML